jgi:hypothetical protein
MGSGLSCGLSSIAYFSSIAKPDAVMVFLMHAAIFSGLRHLDEASSRMPLGSAFLAGLSAGAKYPGVVGWVVWLLRFSSPLPTHLGISPADLATLSPAACSRS